MVTINPAECDRTTVYTGECRNVQDTEWITFDSGRRRSPNAQAGDAWLIDVAYGSFWMRDDQVRNLVRLVPARPVTRDDLPGVHWPGIHGDGERAGADMMLDAVVAHLNADGGLPAEDRSGVDWKAIYEHAERELGELRESWDRIRRDSDRWCRAHAIVEQERNQAREQRDEWKARAEKAATVIDGLKLELANRASRAEAAERERDALREEPWPRDDIKPGDDVVYLGNWHGSSPCPRGAVFTVRAVHEGSGRVSFDWPGVDGACVDLSRVRKVENRAEAAEARTAVTRGDVSDVVHGVFSTWYDNEDMVDAVCRLFGVEAEPADPVEQKAAELFGVAFPGEAFDQHPYVTQEPWLIAARHVLGQEDKR